MLVIDIQNMRQSTPLINIGKPRVERIPVFEEIDPFTKLKIEASFQPYSTGGYISYIECADLTHNIDAVLQVIQYIYDNTMYAELNTKSDYCQKCGYNGEIKIIDVDGKLDWECPNLS